MLKEAEKGRKRYKHQDIISLEIKNISNILQKYILERFFTLKFIVRDFRPSLRNMPFLKRESDNDARLCRYIVRGG